MQKILPSLKWSFALVLGLVMYSCTPATVHPSMPLFMGVTTTVIAILALELMGMEPAVIILSALYILLHIAPPAVVLKPWTSGTVWIICGSIIIGYVIIKAGLARRIALLACCKLGGSYLAVMCGLVVTGFILGPVISSAIGKSVILSAVAVGCCQAMRLEAQSKAATGILMAGFFAADPARMGYLTGGADILIALGFMRTMMPEIQLTWMDYFIHNAPLALAMTLSSVAAAYFLLRPGKRVEAAALRQQIAELPPMSLMEKKAAALLLLVLLVFVSESVHKMNINFVVMLLAGLMFVPEFKLLNREDYPKINLWMVIFIAGCMSIGSTAINLGVDKWAAQLMAPYMEGSAFGVMMKVYVGSILVNMILTPLAACSSLVAPLIELLRELGYNPLFGVYTMLQGLDQYFLPYESAILLFFYATGYMSLKWIIITLAARVALGIVVMMAVAYPYWSILGLM